jgi:iron complex outermembrane receptor protein
VFQDTFVLGTLPAGSSVGKADLEGGNVLARWSRGLGNGGDLSLQTYYDYTSRDIPNTYGERRDTFDVDFQHRLQPTGAHDVLWGAGVRWTGDEIENTTFVTFDPAERQDRTWSAFLQDKIGLRNERMFVTLGSKFEHNDYSGFEVQPSARFSWIINERRAFWSSVSRAARIPSRLDADLRLTVPIGMATIPIYVTANGSRNFDSETLVATEAGYRVRPAQHLSFDVAVFRHDYDQLQTIERQAPIVVLGPPAYAVVPQTLGNLLTGTATGGTFVASWQPLERWRLRFQYTRLDLDLTTEPGSTDTSRVVEDGNSPEDQVAVHSYVDLPRGFQLYTGVRYVDELPNQNVESYIAVNGGAAWSPRENLDISLAVDNLNDARHVEFGTKQIERSAILRARWSF